MKRILFILSILFSMGVSAQTDSIPVAAPAAPVISFGYLSYDSALVAMPEYAIVQKKLSDLREAFNQEMRRVEDEFNQKYESFLEGQRDFPRTILLKRQTELQQLMDRNIEFKAQSRLELHQAEEQAMAPLHARLNEVLAKIAREYNFAVIFNTDSNALPYIDPTHGIDIQEDVKTRLNK